MEKTKQVSNDRVWKLKKQVAVRSRYVFIPDKESEMCTVGFIKQHVGYLQLYKLIRMNKKEKALI